MKKVMKFVKGKKEEEAPIKNSDKNIPIEPKKIYSEKVDDIPREDDFINRDKTITKLHKAVWNENVEKLKSIIKTYDIDITDKLDRTALYFAVLKNNPSIVNFLLENSANQNIPDIDGITPFLKSVQLGYKQCAATLLDYGADIKKTDKDSNSCLHFAILGKQTDMLLFLLEHNADCNTPNVNGEYPLHIATQLQDKELIEILLNHNSDVNVVNNSGLTPLMLAEQLNNNDIVDLIESYSLKLKSNLFPDEISHKSSYENVNTPKIEQKSPNLHSDSENWNDSPVKTPTAKPRTKISKIFAEEIEITEEKSETESVKHSENTSPQSGIIPPPCKPLRSLEYLQSGLAMENRPVHLLTLGTVRTRHISMTESDHSKNNTPHRYSYQGDFQEEKESSIKSKLLSKLEDSTLQSDWGSNESLPLDELSLKKEKSATSSTSKNTSSNSGSIRDNFLQKQFSLLEDYEKNREKRCSASYEVTVPDKSSSKIDIENLLEDNNRINTQLEQYTTDPIPGITKSKSLPRNCEPYNNYHKGSFSLPRTLESGKDPFREMRSYGFKPRSHFSFNLKMLKGDKRSGFLDKLKSMFNKKSQIHLTEQNENGTWLYKKADNEFYEESFSGVSTSRTVHNFSDMKQYEDDEGSTCTLSNNEQNKVIEKKILELKTMNKEGSHSREPSCGFNQTVCSNEDCPCEDKTKFAYGNKSLYSMAKKIGTLDSIFCEECSFFVNQKLEELGETLLSKENFICLLQDQLEQLKNRNIRSITETQELYYKYGVAQQELFCFKNICSQYDDEIQRLRMEKTDKEHLSKYKEEAEKWKKQYEDLVTKMNIEGGMRVPNEECFKLKTDEEKWRSIIQDEVSSAVNMLKENSQIVIASLEKQNKKLEITVEKLQNELDISSKREEKLRKDFEEYDKNAESTIKILQEDNTIFHEDLEKLNNLYKNLELEFQEKVLELEDNLKKTDEMSDEYSIVKDEYRSLTRSLSGLTELVVKAKENALAKNEELRQKVVDLWPSATMKDFIKNITESLESIEKSCECGSEDASQQVTELTNAISDVEKINKLNNEIELKILEVKTSKKISILEEDNRRLKEEIDCRYEDLLSKVRDSGEEIEILALELRNKNDKIRSQSLEICNISDKLKVEQKKIEVLICELKDAKTQLQKEKNQNTILNSEKELLKVQLHNTIQSIKAIEEENVTMKASLSEMENLNDILNTQVLTAASTISEMNVKMEESHKRIEKLEQNNSELKSIVEELRNDEDKTKQYDQQVHTFMEENTNLIAQLNTEKDNVVTLKKHIDTLNSELEIIIQENNTEFEQNKTEICTTKLSLQTQIDNLMQKNIKLQEKLTHVEKENEQLHVSISELNTEINNLNYKLQEPQTTVIEALNKENYEMKSAMNILREILEVKLGEKVNSGTEFVELGKENSESTLASGELSKQIIYCKDICNHCVNINYSLVQKVSNIEKNFSEVLEDKLKSVSLPNLEKIDSETVICIQPESKDVLKRSSSVDCLLENEDIKAECILYEKQLDGISKIRNDLLELVQKLDRKNNETCRQKCTELYLEVIHHLQKQINEMQTRTQEINKEQIAQKSLMTEELYNLRKELYQQKIERIKDTELAKIKKEAEIRAVQQQLRAAYLDNKRKLLADLAAVQNALQEKHEDENKIRKKCGELIKEVTANQEARRKKLENITLLTQPSTSKAQRIVIFDVPDASHSTSSTQSSSYPEKPVKPHALVINARKRLSKLEKHRLSTESVPESNSDDELKEKYLLKYK